MRVAAVTFGGQWGSRVDRDSGEYYPAPRLKLGWQLWPGARWETITSLRVAGGHALIGASDGRTYRAGTWIPSAAGCQHP